MECKILIPLFSTTWQGAEKLGEGLKKKPSLHVHWDFILRHSREKGQGQTEWCPQWLIDWFFALNAKVISGQTSLYPITSSKSPIHCSSHMTLCVGGEIARKKKKKRKKERKKKMKLNELERQMLKIPKFWLQKWHARLCLTCSTLWKRDLLIVLDAAGGTLISASAVPHSESGLQRNENGPSHKCKKGVGEGGWWGGRKENPGGFRWEEETAE